jgi:hypothetical protein
MMPINFNKMLDDEKKNPTPPEKVFQGAINAVIQATDQPYFPKKLRKKVIILLQRYTFLLNDEDFVNEVMKSEAVKGLTQEQVEIKREAILGKNGYYLSGEGKRPDKIIIKKSFLERDFTQRFFLHDLIAEEIAHALGVKKDEKLADFIEEDIFEDTLKLSSFENVTEILRYVDDYRRDRLNLPSVSIDDVFLSIIGFRTSFYTIDEGVRNHYPIRIGQAVLEELRASILQSIFTIIIFSNILKLKHGETYEKKEVLKEAITSLKNNIFLAPEIYERESIVYPLINLFLEGFENQGEIIERLMEILTEYDIDEFYNLLDHRLREAFSDALDKFSKIKGIV